MPPAPATIDYTDSYRAMLHRMAEIGMEAAERIHRHSQSTEAPPNPGAQTPSTAEPRSPSIELDRIARMIRRNAYVSERIGQPLPAPRTNSEGLPLDVARRILARDVEEAIQECADPEHADRLREDLNERLDRPELDDDIEHRPLVQVMTDIRRDMGFENEPGQPAWFRRTAAEWAKFCDRTASRATPSARPGAARPGIVHHLRPTRSRGK